MKKFPHIGAFYQVLTYVNIVNADPECPEQYKVRTPIKYRGTVKLDGANCSTECSREGVLCRSRYIELTETQDLAGFAKFIKQPRQTETIQFLAQHCRRAKGIPATDPIILYGEWVGPGVAKRKMTGVALLPEKQFIIHTFQHGEEFFPVEMEISTKTMDVGIFTLNVLKPVELEVDWTDEASRAEAARTILEHTEAIEKECPWAMLFGVSGIGEGLVWMPVEEAHRLRDELWFKSKGEKHHTVKAPKVQTAPEVLEGIEAFVDFAVTEGRLEQGLEVLKAKALTVEMKNIGEYLRWINTDVERECAEELKTNNLDWKAVSKAVQAKARTYYMTACQS